MVIPLALSSLWWHISVIECMIYSNGTSSWHRKRATVTNITTWKSWLFIIYLPLPYQVLMQRLWLKCSPWIAWWWIWSWLGKGIGRARRRVFSSWYWAPPWHTPFHRNYFTRSTDWPCQFLRFNPFAFSPGFSKPQRNECAWKLDDTSKLLCSTPENAEPSRLIAVFTSGLKENSYMGSPLDNSETLTVALEGVHYERERNRRAKNRHKITMQKPQNRETIQKRLQSAQI